MLAERRDYETYLRSGWRRDGGPDGGAALQLKFNPNHDPKDGRFTFAAGGTGNGGASATARHAASTVARSMPGPFRRHATQPGIEGEVARKLNHIATDRGAVETIKLGGQDITIRRSGSNRVQTSASAAVGGIVAEGRLSVDQDRQAMTISLDSHNETGPLQWATISSLPSRIRIFEAQSGRLNHAIDHAARAKLGFLGIDQPAGTYHFRK